MDQGDEIMEKQKESMNLPAEDRPNSCKISINAKGLASGEVKVYANTINEAMELAQNKAEELTVWIKKKNE